MRQYSGAKTRQKGGTIGRDRPTDDTPRQDRRNRMDDLTRRQRETLDAIRVAIRRHGYPPSRRELAQALGIGHAQSVSEHLSALQKKGYIDVVADVNRGIRLLEDAEVPLVDLMNPIGEVAAGQPIPADDRIVNSIPSIVAEQFSPRPDYFLTVRGDSMDRVGLHDGDIVGVRATPEARNGEIIVARFGDEVTLKRFQRVDARYVELHPESHNPEHQVMHMDLAKHIIHVDGVVVGHIRQKSSIEAGHEDPRTPDEHGGLGADPVTRGR